MRKLMLISGLSTLVVSCGVQEKFTKFRTPIKTITQPVEKPKVEEKKVEEKKTEVINIDKEDYFRTNIGDVSKNDNTISWGSIVSAKPKGYRVTKNHFPALGQNFRQRYLIIHYTALDNEKSIRVLTQQSVSSHYLVNDLPDDEIYQLVDENKRAYHAGISHWRNNIGLNDSSIGIEIVNTGYTADRSGNRQFHAFPEYQFKKVAALAKDIVERYNIPATNVLGHSDIAPSRKQDPGPFFPWKRLYDEYGVGMWYDESTKQSFYETAVMDIQYSYQNPSFITNVQEQFKKFGYDIQVTGTWDRQTQKVIEALQYRFRPANYDGKLDAETWAILQALLIKYPG